MGYRWSRGHAQCAAWHATCSSSTTCQSPRWCDQQSHECQSQRAQWANWSTPRSTILCCCLPWKLCLLRTHLLHLLLCQLQKLQRHTTLIWCHLLQKWCNVQTQWSGMFLSPASYWLHEIVKHCNDSWIVPVNVFNMNWFEFVVWAVVLVVECVHQPLLAWCHICPHTEVAPLSLRQEQVEEALAEVLWVHPLSWEVWIKCVIVVIQFLFCLLFREVQVWSW